MEYKTKGKIIKGVGGLYSIRLCNTETHRTSFGDSPSPLASFTVSCRAKGAFRHEHITPLVGDNVTVAYHDSSFSEENGSIIPSPDGTGIVISEILERKNALIRPPLANLDIIFISMAAASPAPIPETVDKMISIAEFNRIEPVIVIEKCELAREMAEELRKIYTTSGFTVFVLSCKTGEGLYEIKNFIAHGLDGKIAAFAGASGVGKSTLINHLFPDFELETNQVSRKTERGRHTTRHVELFSLGEGEDCGYLADTPGFSMLDFERFDFFSKDDLPLTMREFEDYLGLCRYTKCSHTKEEGCAILEAVKAGKIPKSRHDSFISMYNVLKEKKDWKK